MIINKIKFWILANLDLKYLYYFSYFSNIFLREKKARNI